MVIVRGVSSWLNAFPLHDGLLLLVDSAKKDGEKSLLEGMLDEMIGYQALEHNNALPGEDSLDIMLDL